METEQMQYHTEAGLERIENHVSSLPGVLQCEGTIGEDSTLRSLRVRVESGRSPVQMARDISTSLDDVLDVGVRPEQITVEPEPAGRGAGAESSFYGRRPGTAPSGGGSSSGQTATGEERRDGDDRRDNTDRSSGTNRRSEEDRRFNGDRRSTAERPTGGQAGDAAPGAGAPEVQRGFPERGAAGRRSAPPDQTSGREPGEGKRGRGERPTRSTAPDPDGAESAGEVALHPELEGWAVFGGAGGGVQLQVRVRSASGRHESATRSADLAALTDAVFVDAALRAAERALDAHPVPDRARRILMLEAEGVEDVKLAAGDFVAVTVRGIHRNGERLATGLHRRTNGARSGDACRAALDAVSRLLEGRYDDGATRDDGAAGDGGAPDRDPFMTWG